MEGNPLGQERRKYYRIDDDVVMSYCILGDKEPERTCEALIHDPFSPFSLVSQLKEKTDSFRAILSRIEKENQDLANYLKLIDEKIEKIAQLFVLEKTDFKDSFTQTVSISAGGIGFETTDKFEIDNWIELKIMFCSSLLGIHTFGKIVRVEEINEKNQSSEPTCYFIGVEFEKIRDVDRDFLISHILKKQSLMIRSARLGLQSS